MDPYIGEEARLLTTLPKKIRVHSFSPLRCCVRPIEHTHRFGYVGDLEDRPEASCLYHSEEAENQFMSDPRRAALGDGFRLRPGDADIASATSDIKP